MLRFLGGALNGTANPGSLSEGVYSDEWYNVKISEFRRGDENRPYPRISASTRLNGTSSRNFPAPSLRELGTPSSGRVPFTRPPGNHDVTGDFHRPYETLDV